MLAMFVGMLSLAACSTAPPDGVSVVSPFDVGRYEGKWYEIARLDHRFERGLTSVSATYVAQPDGSVKVINRGWSEQDQAWRESVGKALFTGSEDTGSLKVSFFWPFYGGYHVIALDQRRYQWSMVAGPDRDYLWILSRNPTLPDEIRNPLVAKARSLGFPVDDLIWVDQSRALP
ncbi:MAG: lipocalin family protein [Burkholderiaceae bacterium]